MRVLKPGERLPSTNREPGTELVVVPPAPHVRAILIVLCQSLAQMEGALKKIREVLQAYEKGDWAKLEAIIGS